MASENKKAKAVCMGGAKEFKESEWEIVICLLASPGVYDVIQFVRLDGTVFSQVWEYHLNSSNGCFVIPER
jgi:hypothetical protein